jgi:hypothetical protein
MIIPHSKKPYVQDIFGNPAILGLRESHPWLAKEAGIRSFASLALTSFAFF